MKDILDESIEIKNLEIEERETYTWLTIICSVLAFICFGIMMNSLSAGIIIAREGVKSPSMLIVRSMQILTALSVLFLIMGFIRKEPLTAKKWIALVLSTILFLLVFGSVGFYYFIELTK